MKGRQQRNGARNKGRAGNKGRVAGVELNSQFNSCFSKILARTTCVLVSLPEAKNPGQDAILGHLDFRSSELMIIQSIYL